MVPRHLLVAAVTAVTVIGASTACQPPQVVDVEPGAPFQPATLTADGDDRYQLAGDMTEATVTAPESNKGGNTRVGWTLAWREPTVDHTVCATWAEASGDVDQEGVLLRWDGTRGVSVTKGVWAGVYTVINVHTWNLDAAEPFTLVTQHPLEGLGWPKATAAPLPWRICASAAGTTVRFKVWPLAMAEPADEDPCCSGATTVADTWEGRPGWYAGHLQPGHHVTYLDLTTEAPPWLPES